MALKFTSGAAKRKIKKQREGSIIRITKIDTFFKQHHEKTKKE
jgi:hypothetical protein